MNIIAIDPGANGGIAIHGKVDGDYHTSVEQMPDIYPEIYDVLCNQFHRRIHIAVVERVGFHRQGNNASASAKFARHCGHIEMALYAAGIPIQYVAPVTWQKAMGALPKDYKERKRKVKELMQARYPHINVTDWSADALGILTWALEALPAYQRH